MVKISSEIRAYFFVCIFLVYLNTLKQAIRRVGRTKISLMAYAGQIITHPTLGVSIRFIKTHHETSGAGWETEYTIDAGKGKSLTPHTHLHSDEWFQIIKGQGRYILNGKERRCAQGDEIYLPAGKAHVHPWNTSNGPLIMRNIFLINEPENRNADEIKKMEDYYEHWFHLACRGRVRKNGTPYLLQSAVFLRAVRKQVVIARFPVFLQSVILTPLALAGRLAGFRRTIYE